MRSFIAFFIPIIFFFLQATAQETYLLKDLSIEKGSYYNYYNELCKAGGYVYFSNLDSLHGQELWRIKSSSSISELAVDVIPGIRGASPYGMKAWKDKVFFLSERTPGERIIDLFVWDSKANTLEKLLSVKTGNYGVSIYPDYENRVFITSYVNGERELWSTDGTKEGTIKIFSKSNFQLFTQPLGKKVILYSNNEVWETDGTIEGTWCVSIISPHSIIENFLSTGKNIYYRKKESWGYCVFNYIDSATSCFSPDLYIASDLYYFNNEVYFAGQKNGLVGIYRISDDNNQAELVKTISERKTSYYPKNFITFKNQLYFFADDGINGYCLWKTDGTSEGTALIKDISLYPSACPTLTASEEKMFFLNNDGENGIGLWISDGTSQGTKLVKVMYNKINYPSYNYSPYLNGVIDGKFLFFELRDSIFRSDGTEFGTIKVAERKNKTSDTYFGTSVKLKGDVYFQANGILYKTDGSTSKTSPVTTNGDSILCNNLVYCEGNNLCFFKKTSPYSFTLCSYDGSELHKLKEIDYNSTGRVPEYITKVFYNKDKLFFSFSDTSNKTLNCIYDFTSKSLDKNSLVSYYDEIKCIDGKLFFNGGNGLTGSELWVSDEAGKGARMIKDIVPGYKSSNPFHITSFKGKVYFIVSHKSVGGLWESDGTEEGTILVKAFYTDQKSYFSSGYADSMYTLAGKLYFVIRERDKKMVLWQSDGTTKGTSPFIELGNYQDWQFLGSGIDKSNNLIYFVKYDSIRGQTLYRTDGTIEGTFTLKKVNSEKIYNLDTYSYSVDSVLYFFTYNYTTGVELWKTLGTDNTTEKLFSGFQGFYYYSIFNHLVNKFFFVIDDGIHGSELWVHDSQRIITPIEEEKPFQLNTANNFLVYPNPASEKVHWEIIGSEETFRIVSLYNIEGMKIYSAPEGKVNGSVNTSNLPKGMYFLEVITGEQRFTAKVLVK